MLRERRRHCSYKPNRKLDRKSSRGMIYENEELRIRTININAEVERGQSDIRKLRRENEQLRREIWSLRDEYDRLNKLLKTPKHSNESSNCENDLNSESGPEDSDSCDTCKGNNADEDYIDEKSIENPSYRSEAQQLTSQALTPTIRSSAHNSDHTKTRANCNYNDEMNCTSSNNYGLNTKPLALKQTPSNIYIDYDSDEKDSQIKAKFKKFRDEKAFLQHENHGDFDHLSIVSEENLTNSYDDLSGGVGKNNNSIICYDVDRNISETVSKYFDMQPNQFENKAEIAQQISMIPPLSHFENIINDQFNHDLDLNYSPTSTTTTGETVIPANGWDFNIQSPFAQRKFYPPLTAAPSTPDSIQQIQSDIAIPLETIAHHTPSTTRKSNDKLPTNDESSSVGQPQQKSPKHFFSPIKPQLQHMQNKVNSNISQLTNCASDLIKASQNSSTFVSNPDKRPDLCFPNVVGSSLKYKNPSNFRDSPRTCSPNSFQNGGNLEELLLDIESLSRNINQVSLEKQSQLETGADCNIQQHEIQILNYDPELKNRKPYRSEMNLVLNYNGTHKAIKKSTSETSLEIPSKCEDELMLRKLTDNSPLNRTNTILSLIDSNISSVPDPMELLPTNLPYLGYETFELPPSVNKIATTDNILTYSSVSPQSPPLPPSSFPVQLEQHYQHDLQNHCSNNSDIISKNIPVPSTSLLMSPITMRRSPVALRRQLHVGNVSQEAGIKKSQEDYESIENSQSPTGQVQLHDDGIENLAGQQIGTDTGKSSSGSETIKRKLRRVSILNFRGDKKCSSTSSADDKTKKEIEIERNRLTEENTLSNKIVYPLEKSLSSQDLNFLMKSGTKIHPTNMVNSIGGIVPSTIISTHSTPNSPHSVLRRNNNVLQKQNLHHHHHHHSRHNNNNSLNCGGGNGGIHNNEGRKNHQDIHRSGSSDGLLITSPISGSCNNLPRNKCSRRHSESTVISIHNHSHDSGSGGQNIVLNDVNNDIGTVCGPAGTSISERNSNSLASSRESSTSLSLRSQRRKISINSHNGGKIPWCGCWGNGCL